MGITDQDQHWVIDGDSAMQKLESLGYGPVDTERRHGETWVLMSKAVQVEDPAMDAEFRRQILEADVPLGGLPEGYTGLAWQVTVLWEGAVEDEWLVPDQQLASRHAEALVEANLGEPMTVLASNVYVGEDFVEASGYGPYPSWTACLECD